MKTGQELHYKKRQGNETSYLKSAKAAAARDREGTQKGKAQ